MKFTTVAVLAFACASAFGSFVPYEEDAVYARDLYERDVEESFLESFEKRRGGGGGHGFSKSLAHAAGSFGGNIASNTASYVIQQKLNPQQRRSVSFEKRRGGGGHGYSRSIAHAAGSFGGNVASNVASQYIQQRLNPQQRRSLEEFERRRYSGVSQGFKTHGKGIATSFFNGFAQGAAGNY